MLDGYQNLTWILTFNHMWISHLVISRSSNINCVKINLENLTLSIPVDIQDGVKWWKKG